ncbi:eukaryotic translation initiation factor 3 subunit [Rhizophagus clarus]|uniref:Eukaryotic translation initiation factor 3 subunit n=1 Tax=Rhizophagus clarus TaxID=94130 RepID=A0A8H3MCJ5_9GLOM|nr:eukaryotic translation initiation factor 3 subunit [Rhizophagus clarus]
MKVTSFSEVDQIAKSIMRKLFYQMKKRKNALESSVKPIENAKKINNWVAMVAIQDEFERLSKIVTKSFGSTEMLRNSCQLLATLEANSHLIIHGHVEEEDKEPVIESGQAYGIRGSIVSFIDRLGQIYFEKK